jgi:hypothetical protein
MAYANTKIQTISISGMLRGSLSLIKAFLSRIWDVLVFLGENSARAQKVSRINELSDAQLAARGLTRQEAVRRAFFDGYML